MSVRLWTNWCQELSISAGWWMKGCSWTENAQHGGCFALMSSGHLLLSTCKSELAYLGHGGLTCQMLNKSQHSPPKALAWNSTHPRETSWGRGSAQEQSHRSFFPFGWSWESCLLQRKWDSRAQQLIHVLWSTGLWLHSQGWAHVWAWLSQTSSGLPPFSLQQLLFLDVIYVLSKRSEIQIRL